MEKATRRERNANRHSFTVVVVDAWRFSFAKILAVTFRAHLFIPRAKTNTRFVMLSMHARPYVFNNLQNTEREWNYFCSRKTRWRVLRLPVELWAKVFFRYSLCARSNDMRRGDIKLFDARLVHLCSKHRLLPYVELWSDTICSARMKEGSGCSRIIALLSSGWKSPWRTRKLLANRDAIQVGGGLF